MAGAGGGSSFEYAWYTLDVTEEKPFTGYSSGSFPAPAYETNGRGIEFIPTVGASATTRACAYVEFYDSFTNLKGFSANVFYRSVNDARLTQKHFLGIGSAISSNASADINQTANHIGFLIENTDGLFQVYATNANGTTQTKTQIKTDENALSNTDYYRSYRFINDGSNIYFYIDGTLLATHTTNIPTAGYPTVFVGAGVQAEKTEGTSARYVTFRLRNVAWATA